MVSSNDVAKLAGVSQATVSRVLNTPSKVNEETLAKVNKAIQDLNYRPNAAARSLISRRSGIIALMCGPLDDPDNAEFVGRMVTYAQEKNYRTELYIQDPDEPAAIFETIINSQAEGIIAGPLILVGAGVEVLEKSGIPFVFFGMDNQESGIYISMDNRAAGKMAADYIEGINHRIVAWVGGSLEEPRLHERFQGFKDGMKAHDIEVLNASVDDANFDAVLSAIMARKRRPTAIVADTDTIAADVIDFLIAYGYSIPGDITVMGIGNSKQASMNYLGLTSIGLPEDIDIFKDSMDYLLAMIEDGLSIKRIQERLSPQLYVRKSSAAV